VRDDIPQTRRSGQGRGLVPGVEICQQPGDFPLIEPAGVVELAPIDRTRVLAPVADGSNLARCARR